MSNNEEREVTFLVSVLVEPVSGGEVSLRRARRAAGQAVRNALWDREESGFDHDQDGSVTVRMAGISPFPRRRRVR